MTGYRITKREFYDRGGFSNPDLYRKADRLGRWRHFAGARQ